MIDLVPIRDYSIEPNDAFLRIALNLFELLHAHNSTYEPAFQLCDNWRDRVTEKYLRAGTGSSPPERWVLAFIGSTPAGLLVVSRHDNLYTRYIEIEDLYVIPDQRKQGIGQRLVQDAVDWAYVQGIQDIRLFVAEWNTPARKFYDRIGFSTIQRVLKLNIAVGG